MSLVRLEEEKVDLEALGSECAKQVSTIRDMCLAYK
jgi:hypothetical protein